MSDSWSSFTDTAVDLHSHADQFLQLRDQVAVAAEKLDSKSYTQTIAEELVDHLQTVCQALGAFDSGIQFTQDLIAASQTVATRTDHRSVSVIRFCLQQLTLYLAEVAEYGHDRPARLLVGFNELAALSKKPLLCETLFSVPDAHRVDVLDLQARDLQKIDHGSPPAVSGYLNFSQLMLGVYRGDQRDKKLAQLVQAFESIADRSPHNNSRAFWLACSAFAEVVKIPQGELRPALLAVFKEIEGVLIYSFGDNKAPVLGIQQNVDGLLCNLLCHLYSAADDKTAGAIEDRFLFTSVFSELNQLHQAVPEPLSPWLEGSVNLLLQRLQHCAVLLSEQALQSEGSLEDFLDEISSLQRLFVLVGVHGARANLEEVSSYLSRPVTPESMQSCSTSVQLVEQQLLYQFAFLNAGGSGDDVITDYNPRPLNQSPEVESTDKSADVDNSNAALDFGTHCNLCIDVIQQSLDTALGSSGNLIPDSSVVNALDKLIDIVSAEGVDELTNLLMPLSQLLTESENSTLNQSETLLVQEAIIAATLGIDSLVGQKPMPELVDDVTGRVEGVLESASNRLQASGQRNSSLTGFLVEAAELLPRLFELFQRLRGAPEGATRLYADINRLLHIFKSRADEAGESDLASLVHYLESTMVDLTQTSAPASPAFFDLAIESIECLDEDIERLRNSELAEDRSDLIDRLKLAGVKDGSPRSVDLEATATNANAYSTNRSADATGSPSAVVLLKELTHKEIDWPQRLQRVESCCDAISNSHKQLAELQKQLDATLGSVVSESKDSEADTQAQLHSLASRLEQVTQTQSVAIRQLDQQLGSALLLDAKLLGNSLMEAIDASAANNGIKVQFAFDAGDLQMPRNVFGLLSQSLADLLSSIVTQTFPVLDAKQHAELAKEQSGRLKGSRTLASELELELELEPPTIKVSVQQHQHAIVIDVADDGCGVWVKGSEKRSSNPWSQVARPDYRELELKQRHKRPAVRSMQNNQLVDIGGLLSVAAKFGGTVAISSDTSSTQYRVCLPTLECVHEVLVFETRNRLLALPVAMVESVGLASNNNNSLSLAGLIGLPKRTAFDNPVADGERHCIVCKTSYGLQCLLIDKVIGQQTLQVSTADRILPDVPGYDGILIAESGELAMLLDIDYWCEQTGF